MMKGPGAGPPFFHWEVRGGNSKPHPPRTPSVQSRRDQHEWTHLNATGVSDVRQGHVRGPGNALHHVLMASQLRLALLSGGHPHPDGLGTGGQGGRRERERWGGEGRGGEGRDGEGRGRERWGGEGKGEMGKGGEGRDGEGRGGKGRGGEGEERKQGMKMHTSEATP